MQQSFAPPLLSLSLSNLIYPFPLSLLPSLSYFHASLFSLSYCISLFYYIQPIAHILSFFFDLLMFLFLFCLLCLLSRARCAKKFNLQFSLHALLYFPFAKSTKSFLLLFFDGQVQLASRILLRMLCVNLIFLNFSRLFLW